MLTFTQWLKTYCARTMLESSKTEALLTQKTDINIAVRTKDRGHCNATFAAEMAQLPHHQDTLILCPENSRSGINAEERTPASVGVAWSSAG